ncbi:MAG: hypothetical protein K9L85_04080 [Candidatus Peribacteraceae bacterium]|nr:hypothetical protein [Candidatus Peribacteraceae bacterium]
MKKCFKIFSLTLIVVLFSVAMAVLPSGADIKSKSSEKIYVLEKDGLWASLNILEENAIAPAFQVEIAKRVESQKIEKKPREQTLRQTIKSSLESLGLVISSGPDKITGSNVFLTLYKEKDVPPGQSDEAEQAAAFNSSIGKEVEINITPEELEYLKKASVLERIYQFNQRAAKLGMEITPEIYTQFNKGNKAERVQQVIEFVESAGLSISEKDAETFVEEYSKFPGIPPL